MNDFLRVSIKITIKSEIKGKSKSMFGISEDSVKYYCSKCYKGRCGSTYIDNNSLIK